MRPPPGQQKASAAGNIVLNPMVVVCPRGLAVGFWKDKAEIEAIRCVDRNFIPGMPPEAREKAYRGWKRAVERARAWDEGENAVSASTTP